MKNLLLISILILSQPVFSCTLKNLTGKGDPHLQIQVENEVARSGHKMAYGEEKSDFTLVKIETGKKKKKVSIAVKDKSDRVVAKVSYPVNRVEMRSLIGSMKGCGK